MTVAFDSSSAGVEFHNFGSWGSANPYTFSGPTPVSTPKGVVVFILAPGSSIDMLPTVTYGGVAMTKVDTAAAVSTPENQGCYSFFLGSGIPAGAQTVSIAYDDSDMGVKKAVCIVLTAGADTTVVAHGLVTGIPANPSVTLDSGAVVAIRLVALSSGHVIAETVTLGAGLTAVLAGEDATALAQSRHVARQTTPSSGSVAVGYTTTTDDVAMTALAVAELAVVSSGVEFIGGGFF